jgi:hypothetical protein
MISPSYHNYMPKISACEPNVFTKPPAFDQLPNYDLRKDDTTARYGVFSNAWFYIHSRSDITKQCLRCICLKQKQEWLHT